MNYLEKLKIKEIDNLKQEIQDLQDELESLKQNNDDLSKLIHKDNKLIPAMEHAVMALLDMAVFPDESAKRQADDLLNSLNALSSERTGVLTSYKNTYNSPAQTGVTSIDAMCRYMEQRALAMGGVFRFSFLGNMKYLTENLIDESKLTTLIADLAENALISMKETTDKSAMLSLRIENNIYILSVYDSGVPFQAETIKQFGIKRTTTHQQDGGSGIGLMTLYEILRECGASFLLDETVPNSSYTKMISIYFDGANEIRIKSKRPEIRALRKVRKDFIFT